MGAFKGYASDMTRMLGGFSSTKVKRMYRAVLEAQLAARRAPGVTTVSVDTAARRDRRLWPGPRVHTNWPRPWPEIHEPPRLGKRDRHRLRTGMAITIEPGAYRRLRGANEDTVVVAKRLRDPATTPKDLRGLGVMVV